MPKDFMTAVAFLKLHWPTVVAGAGAIGMFVGFILSARGRAFGYLCQCRNQPWRIFSLNLSALNNE